MRISHQMLHQNSTNHIQQNLSRLEKSYNQASTGKVLLRPSDDPNGVSKAMNLKSAIAANEQYGRNTGQANLWIEESEQTMGDMVNVLHRARELAVQGSNDTLSESDRTIIATEVEHLTEQLRQFANAKVNGNYLFNGQETKTAPFPEKNSYLNDGFDRGAKNFSIADGIVIQGNVTADRLFGNAGDNNNLFATLTGLSEGLRSGGELPLAQIDQGFDRLLKTMSEVGAVKNRVDAVENRILDSNLTLKTMLSKIEDIDMAAAITKLKSEESIYQASLSSSARIIQPSLMDFLR